MDQAQWTDYAATVRRQVESALVDLEPLAAAANAIEGHFSAEFAVHCEDAKLTRSLRVFDVPLLDEGEDDPSTEAASR